MRSEQEIRDTIGRLEQLQDKYDREGDYDLKLDVEDSIRQLEWALGEREIP